MVGPGGNGVMGPVLNTTKAATVMLSPTPRRQSGKVLVERAREETGGRRTHVVGRGWQMPTDGDGEKAKVGGIRCRRGRRKGNARGVHTARIITTNQMLSRECRGTNPTARRNAVQGEQRYLHATRREETRRVPQCICTAQKRIQNVRGREGEAGVARFLGAARQ